MTEATDVAKPVGRARRISGLIVIALGVLIVARVGWLGTLHSSGFGRVEWLRFAFWLWIGVVCALTGCWLRYHWRVAGWTAVIAVPTFFGLVYVASHLGI
jgi:hypothetical protein